MAIKVSGTTVIDNSRNINAGIITASSIDVPPAPLSFSPADNSTGNDLDTNIVITYSASVLKGSGNITLREGSASGSVIETIAVSSGNVTISGAEVTINPSSDIETGKDVYVVVDAGAFVNSALNSDTELLNTYNFTTGPVAVSSFSPTDADTDVLVDSNIVLTFSTSNIAKGSGNITIRSGSASGTAQQTIDVTSGAVSISGNTVTINPPSDMAHETDTYIVVDAGCFTNTDGDAASGNAIINTYNFTTRVAIDIPPLGGTTTDMGGYLINCQSNVLWVVAPSSTEVSRNFYQRSHASFYAEQSSGCTDWFIPTCVQLKSPGYTCRQYWDSYCPTSYFSDTDYVGTPRAYSIFFQTGGVYNAHKNLILCVRAFRCVSY